MKSLTAAVSLLLVAAVARAQPISVEVDQTAGYSSERLAASSSQVRVFGDVTPGLRINVEGAWAARSGKPDESDVFEAAYPYSNRIELMEAYAEHVSQAASGVFGLRVGRYRTPFGIHEASDHAYLGFLRAPLIRYEGYYALSNTFLEHGVDVIAGKPQLFLEASAGVPGDVGSARRRAGASLAMRGQASRGPMIVGLSFVDTLPSMDPSFALGRTRFAGVDMRWMSGGVQLRGEWLGGRPFDGTTTTGGYVDLIVHRPAMGPITAVARVERLVYTAVPPYNFAATRQVVGGRIRVLHGLTAQIEAVHNSRQLPQRRSVPVDVALTYSLRRH